MLPDAICTKAKSYMRFAYGLRRPANVEIDCPMQRGGNIGATKSFQIAPSRVLAPLARAQEFRRPAS